MKTIFSLAIVCSIFLACISTCSASLGDIEGDWYNKDANTDGITRLKIGVSGDQADVHAWSRCHPNDCDWGTVNAFAFSSNVSTNPAVHLVALVAVYDTQSSETIMIVRPQGDELSLHSYTRFKDNSGRFNYASSDSFRKRPQQEGSPICRTEVTYDSEGRPIAKTVCSK